MWTGFITLQEERRIYDNGVEGAVTEPVNYLLWLTYQPVTHVLCSKMHDVIHVRHQLKPRRLYCTVAGTSVCSITSLF